MNINNLYEIHFSPTGGTKETVDKFSTQWNVPKSIIDLADMSVEFDKYEFYGDDLCVIGVPSFGGRVPLVAVQRLKQMKANNTPAVIIATYGNRNYDDTLIELQEIIEDVGFCVVAALTVVTQHSLLPHIATGRPDGLDKKRLIEMSIKVKVHIERASGFNKAKLSDNKKTYKEYKGVPIKPYSTGKCIKCGICAENCPVGAIPLDNPKLTDNEKCISCMRCVRRCPKGARKVSGIKLAIASLKLKKACQERKEIEIFVNKNLNKDAVVENNVENKKVEEVLDSNKNVVFDTSLENIEEISVKDISIAEAELDIDSKGLPKKKDRTKDIAVNNEINVAKIEKAKTETVKAEVVETEDGNKEQPKLEVNQVIKPENKLEVNQVIKLENKPEVNKVAKSEVKPDIRPEVKPDIRSEIKPLKSSTDKPKGLPNTMSDINKLFNSKDNPPLKGLRPKEEVDVKAKLPNLNNIHQEEKKVLQKSIDISSREEKKVLPKSMDISSQEEKKVLPKDIDIPSQEVNKSLDEQDILPLYKDLLKETSDSKENEINNDNVYSDNYIELKDIADFEVEREEPEEIIVPEVMKNVSLDDIDNDPYELDEDLLDDDEIEDIMELDEIVEEYNSYKVEDPKDFVLDIDIGLEDIVFNGENEEISEEIEDEIGIILEDK